MGRHKGFKHFANAGKYKLLQIERITRDNITKPGRIEYFGPELDDVLYAKPRAHLIVKTLKSLGVSSEDGCKFQSFKPCTQIFNSINYIEKKDSNLAAIIPSPELFSPLTKQYVCDFQEREIVPPSRNTDVATQCEAVIFDSPISVKDIDPNIVLPIILLGNSPTEYDA